MAESELSVTYADLLKEVARFLGYGSDSSAWTADQLEEVDGYVQSGARRFYYPPAANGAEAGYSWSFLSPVATLTTTADDAAQDLPADLGRVLGNFHYEEGEHQRSIVQVSEAKLMELVERTASTGHPEVATVRHRAKDAARGQRFEVAWWPIPDAAYTLTFRYEAFNGKLSADNPYPLGGMRHAELIVQSCLAVAELRANDERGHHSAEYDRLLAAAIEQDRRIGARYYGAMGDRSDCAPALPRRGDTGSSYSGTYKGVPW